METITCESCQEVIAVADSYEEAKEVAQYEKNANPHDGDTDSGDWECEACENKRMAEGMADAHRYYNSREYRIQQETARYEADREAMLEKADRAYDEARDRGEI